MPKSTPLIKVESTKQYGAEVVLHGDVYDDAFKKAKELEEKKDIYLFILLTMKMLYMDKEQ